MFSFIDYAHSNIIPSSEQNFQPYKLKVIFLTLVEIRIKLFFMYNKTMEGKGLNNLTKNIESNQYEKIGPTAWAVSYQRSLADIKYAKEIFEELITLIESSSEKDREYFEKAKSSKTTAQLEARFKLINKILKEYNPKKILEIAAGLSPRGLAMAEENSDLEYVEVDLPNMAIEKSKILRDLEEKNIGTPKNLQVIAGDALDLETLLVATKNIKLGSFAVVNEGLLRYLKFEEKKKVAENVKDLLKRFGGIWITPDITTHKAIVSTTKGAEYQRIKDLAGIDIDANSFRDEQHAREFFQELGFEIESHRYSEVENDLVAPQKAGMTKDEIHDTIAATTPVFVMRIKSSE